MKLDQALKLYLNHLSVERNLAKNSLESYERDLRSYVEHFGQKLVSNDLVKRMKPGSVLVDIAIDQGGCFEDSKATTHDDPTYKIHNSIFYCVANMPGSVPNTSTYALTNVTMPYAKAIANKGWKKAIADDKSLRLGLNVHEGLITYKAVADAFNLEYTPAEKLISA